MYFEFTLQHDDFVMEQLLLVLVSLQQCFGVPMLKCVCFVFKQVCA